MSRDDIVKAVVNEFIKTESQQRGPGVKFRYPVEDLSTGQRLFIIRPAGLRKFNFDFKVEVLPEFGLGKGKHEDIASDFKAKKRESPGAFSDLKRALSDLHDCREGDVDQLLRRYPALQGAFHDGAKVDVLLKVVKWMFIMEDIVYWNYKGRSMLYDGLMKL